MPLQFYFRLVKRGGFVYTVTILYAKNLCSKSSKAQIDVDGSVKVTLKITASGQSTPVKTVTRTWSIAALTQEPNAAKPVIGNLVKGLTVTNTSDATSVKNALNNAITSAKGSHTLADKYTLQPDSATPVAVEITKAATWNLKGTAKITVKWQMDTTAQTPNIEETVEIANTATTANDAATQINTLIQTDAFKAGLAGNTNAAGFINLLKGTGTSAYELSWKEESNATTFKNEAANDSSGNYTISGKLHIAGTGSNSSDTADIDNLSVTFKPGT